MLKCLVPGLLSVMLCAPTAAIAQRAGAGGAETVEVDAALFEKGQQLYEANCIECHQSGGGGMPPDFPALAGNDRLADLDLIVRNINRGKEAMPAFPDLSADETAALATFVRNAWDNEFRGVTPEEVASILEGLEEIGELASVWDGVYTQEQAKRGQQLYTGNCADCHGRRLNGAPEDPDMTSTPALARASFLRKWDGRSVATLYGYIRATMPESNPGYLSDQQYIDIIAYMFTVNKMIAGDVELVPDTKVLAGIVMGQQP